MNKFVFGNADKKGVYYDEENRRHLNTIRMQYSMVAINLADGGRKEDAKKLLERCDKMMTEENFPYGMVSRRQQHDQISSQFLLAAYKAGDSALVTKITALVRKDLEQQITYFNSLDEDKQAALSYENELVQKLLSQLAQMDQYFKSPQSILNTENKGKITNQPTLSDSNIQDTNAVDKKPGEK